MAIAPIALSAYRAAMDTLEIDTGPTPFQELGNVSPRILAQILRNEHPQTLALILGHLHPDQAAELLQNLPSGVRAEVLMIEPINGFLRQEVAESQTLDECFAAIKTLMPKKAGMFPAFFCEKRKGRCVKRPAPQAGVLSA